MYKERKGQLYELTWSHIDTDFSGAEYAWSGDDFAWYASEEAIRYNRPDHEHYGNCHHTLIERNLLYSDSLVAKWSYDPATPEKWFQRKGNYFGYITKNLAANPEAIFSGNLVRLKTDTELSAEALDKMMPTLESDLSLTNFLLELRDFKKLFSIITESLPKLLAAAHLNYEFGWKPFLGDIQKILNLLGNFDKLLSKLIAEQHQVNVRHASIPLPTPEPVNTDGFDISVKWKTEPIYRATMKYSYSLPELSHLQMKVRGALDAFGLDISASVIWEAIPFSFVVDWFIDVQGFLSQFNKPYLEPKIKIIDFCSSIKWDFVAYLAQDFAPHGQLVERFEFGSVRKRYYERIRHTPSTKLRGLGLSHRFGGRQLGLSASLLTMRSRSR